MKVIQAFQIRLLCQIFMNSSSRKKDNFAIFLTKNSYLFAIREYLRWSSMWFWAMGSRTGKLTELINNWIAVCVSDALWLNPLKILKNKLILPRIQFLCLLLSSSVGGTKVCDFIDSSHSWNGEEKRNREKNWLRILSCPVLPCEITTYSTHANPLIVFLGQSSFWITSATPTV